MSGVQGDVLNLADLDRLCATVKKEKDRIDILFANADVGELAHWEQLLKRSLTKRSGPM
jgi:hypothetical protein